jgi:hypothetical protein
VVVDIVRVCPPIAPKVADADDYVSTREEALIEVTVKEPPTSCNEDGFRRHWVDVNGLA